MAYVTQEHKEAVFAKRIARPRAKAEEEPWRQLGYPDEKSFKLVQRRQLKNQQRLSKRRRQKIHFFRSQISGGHKLFRPALMDYYNYPQGKPNDED